MTPDSYCEIGRVGVYARDVGQRVVSTIRKYGPQTVFVMDGMVCATPAGSRIAEAIDDPAPIVGTYGARSSSVEIAEDIKAWRAAA